MPSWTAAADTASVASKAVGIDALLVNTMSVAAGPQMHFNLPESCTKLLDTETKSLRLAKNRAGPVSVDADATLTQ
jgi:hypothetical protein